jgi:predicted DNA-binding antitoxin AbrB/MazE fold protein
MPTRGKAMTKIVFDSAPKTISTAIAAVYENGVIRPLEKLNLVEGQTVQIQILPEPALTELEQIERSLFASGLISLPPMQNKVTPVPSAEWQALMTKLRRANFQPLSETVIAERNER